MIKEGFKGISLEMIYMIYIIMDNLRCCGNKFLLYLRWGFDCDISFERVFCILILIRGI